MLSKRERLAKITSNKICIDLIEKLFHQNILNHESLNLFVQYNHFIPKPKP